MDGRAKEPDYLPTESEIRAHKVRLRAEHLDKMRDKPAGHNLSKPGGRHYTVRTVNGWPEFYASNPL